MITTLKDIIDNIVLETQDSDSIFRNKQKYRISAYAKDGLKKLNLTFATHLKAFSTEIPASAVVFKPEGFEQLFRVYLKDDKGNTVAIRRNNLIPDEMYQILPDSTTSETITYNEDLYEGYTSPCALISPEKYCTQPFNGYFYLASDKYKDSWVAESIDALKFSPDLEGLYVIVEYLSNQTDDVAECDIVVEEGLAEALEYYVKFKLLENGLETMGQAQYYNRKFKALRDKYLTKTAGFTTRDIYEVLKKR